MRPLRLSVEGFTCFKERQPPLDFSDLSLFAISGPTGAGKSSLLDAMVFALYGRVPRMRKGFTELISLGRERMAVVFDFGLGGRAYRVTRVARRGKPGNAQLEELVGGEGKPLAGGVTGVDKQIERLLGLRYDAFTQAVVLPQGEFARFLKSQPGDRREILRDLLRLQVYERMRERAREQSVELQSQVRSREERLSQDYAGVTAEALAELEHQAGDAARQNEELRERHQAETARVHELRLTYEKTKELRAERERAGKLRLSEPEMSARQRRLETAAKAAQVFPLVEQALRAASQAARDAEGAEKAREEREQARRRHDSARKALERAGSAAAAISSLRERLRALDEVSGLIAPLQGARRRSERMGKERAAVEKELAALHDAERGGSAKLGKLEKTLARLNADLAGIGYGEALDGRLDPVREAAAEISRERRAQREEEARASAAEREAREKAAAAAAGRCDLERIAHELSHAEAARRKAEQESMAEALRRSVAVGERCPVCDQPVKRLPAAKQLSLLERTAAGYEDLKKREAVARQNVAEMEALAASCAGAARAAREEADRLRRLVEERAADLENRVGADVETQPGRFVEDKVLAAAKHLGALRKKYRDSLDKRAGLEKELVEARHEEASRRQAAEAHSENLERRAAELSEIQDEIERLEARINQVTRQPDPTAERREVAGRIERMERDLKQAEQEERHAATALAGAESAAQAAESRASASARSAEDAHRAAEKAARDAGFSGVPAVQEASVPEEERAAIGREIEQYRAERRAAERRVAELEAELGGRELDQEALGRAEQDLQALGRRREEGLKAEASLRQRIEELTKKLDSARGLLAQLKCQRREHAIYQQLAEDLASKRFQAYLLEETFRELVGGASGRLLQLSERYTLDFKDENFYVLDRENAGERRNADTLSGGETFLASLALALELSEQVQRAAGAVHLDSLFIDEGFGTLDPETLDTVAAAIEMLPVGGRMVGIITHLPELTARLPARIRVTKHAEGSRACLDLG